MIKNKIKLSLATVIAISTLGTTLNASSLADNLTSGKFKGELKSYYFTKNHNTDKTENIWVNGASLNYVTAPLFGLGVAGFTLQVADTTNTDTGTKFDKYMKGSGSVFSEAYLATKVSKTGVKLGRQFIKTPLIYGSGSRMIKQSFQGYTIGSQDIKDTTILAIHLDKYQSRTNGTGDVGEFNDTFDYIGLLEGTVKLKDGANSIFVQNKSINNLDLMYQYLNAKDFAKTNFMQGTYNLGTLANIKVTAQQYKTSWDANAISIKNVSAANGLISIKDAKITGYKIESTINDINIFAATTKNNSDGDVMGGLGLAADAILTAGYVNGGNYLHNSSSTKYGINTTISDIKLSLWKSTHKNEKNNVYDTFYGADYSETDFMADYDLNKNLHLRVLIAKYSGTLKKLDDAPDYNYQSRVKLTYSF